MGKNDRNRIDTKAARAAKAIARAMGLTSVRVMYRRRESHPSLVGEYGGVEVSVKISGTPRTIQDGVLRSNLRRKIEEITIREAKKNVSNGPQQRQC